MGSREKCIESVAKAIMSEASVGNRDEQIAIGFACQRNKAHASGQTPTAAIRKLAEDIVNGSVEDPTNGADHWYSPRSMPKEDEAYKCKPQGECDCRGGLEQVEGLTKKTFRPSWADESKRIYIPNIRESYFKFFRLGGAKPMPECQF